MKVLNVLFDDRYGGPQKRVVDVGHKLMERGVETVLLLPDGDGNAAGVAEKQGLSVVRVPFNRMPNPKHLLKVLKWMVLLPRDIYLITKVIKNEEIDVVHVNGAFFLAPALATKICRRPLVWHLNDTIVKQPLAWCLGVIVRLLSSEVVVAAKAVARHYRVIDASYSVIYAPVDVGRIKPKRDYGNAGCKKKIGLVANWNPIKGLEVFVESIAIVQKNVAFEVEFYIAGSKLQSHSCYADGIDALIKAKGLNNIIHQVGFVEDIPVFLQGLDVLVLASWSEACPMAVLEAMASGLPVVSTDVGGVRELLTPLCETPSGYVVNPGDAQGMADKVMVLLSDEALCERMGLQGRMAAEKTFSIDICASSHLTVYQNAITSN